MNRKFEKGDVVRFTREFFADPYSYVTCYQGDVEMSKIMDVMDYSDIGRALSQVEAVVTGFWGEGVWLEYKLLGRICKTNNFDWEVEKTGERRPYNDPSRYNRTLLDLINEVQ